MTINITDVQSWATTVRSVATGDAATQTNFLFGMQDLANRSAWLASQIGGSLSRAASSGVQLLRFVDNITALLAVSTDLNTHEIMRVGSTGIYHYDAASTTTVNSPYVIAPTSVGSGAGRWILDQLNATPGGDLGGTTIGSALVEQLSGGFGGNTGFVSVPSGSFLGFGAFATMSTTGVIRLGNVQNTAINIIFGRNNTNTANMELLVSDGFGNYSLGDFQWTVGQINGGVASALDTASGSFQYNAGSGLFFAAGAILAQSVTGLFKFNNPSDTLLTGWKFQLASVDILNIGQNADGVNALISTAAWQGTTRTVSAATYTVDASGPDQTIFVDTTSNVVAIKLPPPRAGRQLQFKDAKFNFGVNKFNLVQNGTEKIEGVAATRPYTAPGTAITVESNGTDWFVWS